MNSFIIIETIPASAGHQRRRAFTLVELLVVITVMVALAGMLTYALAGAATDAKIKRTEADVLTIGQLLQSRMNEVSLSRTNIVYGPASTPAGTVSGLGTASTPFNPGTFAAQERSRLILSARRDLLRMVLPECRADLLMPPVSIQFRAQSSTGGWQANVAQVKPPAQWDRMRSVAGLLTSAELDAAIGSNPVSNPALDGIAFAYNAGYQAPFYRFSSLYQPGNSVDTLDDDPALPANTGDPDDRFWSRENESAECLYLILATTELFGQRAIDKIQSSNIGDTDGDGFLEILDAWGQPYEMIRTPVGLRNRAIKNFDPGGATLAEQYPPDPDPLDFLLADYRFDLTNYGGSPPASLEPFIPFYAPPVVISAGRDGEFGIRRSFWIDDGTPQGVKDFYCSSTVVVGTNTPTPSYPGMVYRYPDPFYNVSSALINGTQTFHAFDISGTRPAREGGGFGGELNRELSADNITSLDADF